jgi:hypothetical protein
MKDPNAQGDDKSVGSGYFSAFVGVISIIFAAIWYYTPRLVVTPRTVLAIWLVSSGLIMTFYSGSELAIQKALYRPANTEFYYSSNRCYVCHLGSYSGETMIITIRRVHLTAAHLLLHSLWA